MVNLAKIHVRNIDRGDFDSDPWLFNCVTGTIDLKTGACREHRREDLICKLAPVKYDPAADCSLWKKCLSDWMLGDEEKVGYSNDYERHGKDTSESFLCGSQGAQPVIYRCDILVCTFFVVNARSWVFMKSESEVLSGTCWSG